LAGTDGVEKGNNEIGEDIRNDRFDADAFWKALIDRFFYSLLKRALPELYAKADLNVKPRFLEKEFLDILNTGDPEIHKSAHFADYVLEVPLKNGGDEWILFHIEAQGLKGGNLPERMNFYRCLIYAHYRREPAALAIITVTRPRKEERKYSYSRFGTDCIYRYNNLVLRELDDDELLSSDNPIDLVLYAAKAAVKSKRELQKYSYLRTLAGLLSERGWSAEDKRDLMLFIERVLYLKNKKLIEQYGEYRQQLDREGKIMYIPFLEREKANELIQSGMEQGIERGKEEMARSLLANGVSPDVIAKSAGLPVEQIRALAN
jgi:predicted transposase/invertase (TIGR01784 family)